MTCLNRLNFSFETQFYWMWELQRIHNKTLLYAIVFPPAVTFFLWLLLFALIFGWGALDSSSRGGSGCWCRGFGSGGLGIALNNVVTWWHCYFMHYRRDKGKKISRNKWLNNELISIWRTVSLMADIPCTLSQMWKHEKTWAQQHCPK